MLARTLLRRSCALLFASGLSLLPLTAAAAPLRVAFVVDDGPDAAQAAAWLRILKEAGAKVSFSYVGRAVRAEPTLARLAKEAGHEINNHSFTHPNLTQLDDAKAQAELNDTADEIERATGERPRWFWAPFLASDARIDGFARACGSIPFPTSRFHFISTDDWNAKTDAATIYKKATTGIVDGTVILCHEWRQETVEQLPAILSELKRQGATFVTFSELTGGKP